jgi:hypothetical protein
VPQQKLQIQGQPRTALVKLISIIDRVTLKIKRGPVQLDRTTRPLSAFVRAARGHPARPAIPISKRKSQEMRFVREPVPKSIYNFTSIRNFGAFAA